MHTLVPTTVVIEVEGGLVQNVFSTVPLHVYVIDWDVAEGAETLEDLDDGEAAALHACVDAGVLVSVAQQTPHRSAIEHLGLTVNTAVYAHEVY